MKFIHIADVHLGVKPDQGKPWSEQRARQIWDSFADVIGVAKREKPEFLFVTGDLFHAQPLKKEVREVSRLFGEIPDTQVLLLPAIMIISGKSRITSRICGRIT